MGKSKKFYKGLPNKCYQIDGLINRKVYQIVPPKVEYSLTDFGSSVIPVLRSLHEWNKKNGKTISNRLNKNFEEKRI